MNTFKLQYRYIKWLRKPLEIIIIDHYYLAGTAPVRGPEQDPTPTECWTRWRSPRWPPRWSSERRLWRTWPRTSWHGPTTSNGPRPPTRPPTILRGSDPQAATSRSSTTHKLAPSHGTASSNQRTSAPSAPRAPSWPAPHRPPSHGTWTPPPETSTRSPSCWTSSYSWRSCQPSLLPTGSSCGCALP